MCRIHAPTLTGDRMAKMPETMRIQPIVATALGESTVEESGELCKPVTELVCAGSGNPRPPRRTEWIRLAEE